MSHKHWQYEFWVKSIHGKFNTGLCPAENETSTWNASLYNSESIKSDEQTEKPEKKFPEKYTAYRKNYVS